MCAVIIGADAKVMPYAIVTCTPGSLVPQAMICPIAASRSFNIAAIRAKHTPFDKCYDQCHATLTKENKLDEETKLVTCYNNCKKHMTEEEATRYKQVFQSLANYVERFLRLMDSAN
ncbi:unnamed protein product [Cylicocyclus nassatus]|uniref:Uncharacterized protein n=1 Tax=Cylicocyclus nassatus TaxID=53992 RepID=A0AA36DIW3_CYLNA|nr:unnamed protein product [Cylicocyclus nassatus]